MSTAAKPRRHAEPRGIGLSDGTARALSATAIGSRRGTAVVQGLNIPQVAKQLREWLKVRRAEESLVLDWLERHGQL